MNFNYRCSVFCAGAAAASLTDLGCFDVVSSGASPLTCNPGGGNITVSYCQGWCLSECPTCQYTLVDQTPGNTLCCACYETITDAELSSNTATNACTKNCRDDSNSCGDGTSRSTYTMNAYLTSMCDYNY